MALDPSISPDTKDWTWVITTTCPECGFDAAAFDRELVGSMVRDNAAAWPELLAAPDSARRPAPEVWSALEYACHVRDVFRIFDERLWLMLNDVGPLFENWDQDETAVADRYGEQDPRVVAEELRVAAQAIADRFDTVAGPQWKRTGERSDGSHFTVGDVRAGTSSTTRSTTCARWRTGSGERPSSGSGHRRTARRGPDRDHHLAGPGARAVEPAAPGSRRCSRAVHTSGVDKQRRGVTLDAVDSTVIPPAGVLDASIRPTSLASVGSVLSGDRFCPECDRDLADELAEDEVVLCETCVGSVRSRGPAGTVRLPSRSIRAPDRIRP